MAGSQKVGNQGPTILRRTRPIRRPRINGDEGVRVEKARQKPRKKDRTGRRGVTHMNPLIKEGWRNTIIFGKRIAYRGVMCSTPLKYRAIDSRGAAEAPLIKISYGKWQDLVVQGEKKGKGSWRRRRISFSGDALQQTPKLFSSKDFWANLL